MSSGSGKPLDRVQSCRAIFICICKRRIVWFCDVSGRFPEKTPYIQKHESIYPKHGPGQHRSHRLADIDPAQFVWMARPIVVFAQTPNDPQYAHQMDLLTARIDELALRDVIVITDTNPDTPSALRNLLRPRGFMLAIISKDGRTALRKPAPWDVREISRSIDKMPLRQQEIRDRRVVE